MTKRRIRVANPLAINLDLREMSVEALVALREDIGSALGVQATTARLLRERQDALTIEIRQRSKPGVRASDHAVIRWLERFKGLDVVAVRQEIVDAATEAIDGHEVVVHKRGDAASFTKDGITYVVSGDMNVVTLYLDDGLGAGRKT